MDYSLAPLPSLKDSRPDLRKELERNQKQCRQVVTDGAQVRLADMAGEPVVRLGDELLPLSPAAASLLASLVPLHGPSALLTHRHDVEAWFATQQSLGIRIQERCIVAIMLHGWRVLDDLELLEIVLAHVADSGIEAKVDRCQMKYGEWMLTLVAPELSASVAVGDYIYGGLYLSSSPVRDTESCTRIFRVLCSNGALADMSEARRLVLPRLVLPGTKDPYSTWRENLGQVIETSFLKVSVDEDAQRLKKTIAEILSSPYEHLCHLRAQQLITAEEQVLIQREFSRVGDQSLYGLINSITSIAHTHRSNDEWRRAIAMERLGGEILRGDHMPPTLTPAFRR